jgi:Leucine Rich repeat
VLLSATRFAYFRALLALTSCTVYTRIVSTHLLITIAIDCNYHLIHIAFAVHYCRNSIGSTGAAALGAQLSRPFCSLQHLRLGFNSVGDSGAQSLGLGLLHNTSLHTLALHHNCVQGRGAMVLARAVRATAANAANAAADAADTASGTSGSAKRVLTATHCQLQQLDLRGNALGEAGGRALLRAVLMGAACTVDLQECTFAVSTTLMH